LNVQEKLNKDESNKDCIIMLVKEKILKNKALFTNEEMPRDSRTRAKCDFSKAKMCDIISRYIESLWEGITERLTHFVKDGTTSWSEALA